ncbi:hypothetical protein Tco_0787942 [Tanacetum coccineum]
MRGGGRGYQKTGGNSQPAALNPTTQSESNIEMEHLNMKLPSIVGLKSIRYGVSKVLDMVYWGFLRVGTTFDIFQNILFPYSLNTAYCLLLDMAYWILFPSWSGECRHRYAVSSLMDTAYWMSEQ